MEEICFSSNYLDNALLLDHYERGLQFYRFFFFSHVIILQSYKYNLNL